MTGAAQPLAKSTAFPPEKSLRTVDVVLIAAVFLIPFISWGEVPWLLGPFVLLVAGVLLAVIREGSIRGSVQIPEAPVWIPLAMVLGLSLIHLVRTPIPYSSFLFLVHLALAAVFYYLLWSRLRKMAVVAMVLVRTGILVTWVAVQALVLGMRPPAGPFLNPNYTATVLLVCLAMALGSLMPSRERKWETAIMLSAAMLGSVGLMLIGSRSGGLGMILLWAAYLIFRRGRMRWVAILVIAMIILLPNTIRHRVTEGYKADPHAFSRLLIWESSLRMGADHPLIGVGPNLFYEYAPVYAFPTEELPVRYGRIARKPHNEYLRSWAEGGVIGVIGLGLFLFITLRMMLHSIKLGRPGPALAVGIILYQALFHDITEVFSLMVLMSWCLAQITPETDRTVEPGNGPRRFIPVATGVVILCFALWLNLDLASRAFWFKGKRLMDVDLPGALRTTKAATLINPLLPGASRDLARIRLMMSDQDTDEQELSRVLAATLRAQSLNRLDTVPPRLQAAIYIKAARQGEMKAAEALAAAAGKLKEASLIEPHNALILLNMAEVYWDLGQRERALDLLDNALRKEPNYLQAHRTRISWLSKLDPGRITWAQSELAEAQERAAGYRPQSDFEEIILR
ncbi:O-antigen ligase family protein [bacterium]|nr:O-antigen ligase family protein [bacterium]